MTQRGYTIEPLFDKNYNSLGTRVSRQEFDDVDSSRPEFFVESGGICAPIKCLALAPSLTQRAQIGCPLHCPDPPGRPTVPPPQSLHGVPRRHDFPRACDASSRPDRHETPSGGTPCSRARPPNFPTSICSEPMERGVNKLKNAVQ